MTDLREPRNGASAPQGYATPSSASADFGAEPLFADFEGPSRAPAPSTVFRQEPSAYLDSVASSLTVLAVITAGAWITVPLGPVPFTLQTFAFALALLVFPAKECLVSLAFYLVVGCLGAPVFSGMRGGLSVLAGPTGGYLWGFFLGALAALAFRSAHRAFRQSARPSARSAAEGAGEPTEPAKRGPALLGGLSPATSIASGAILDAASVLIMIAIAYACGTFQYAVLAAVPPSEAFAACIAPFVASDLAEAVAAVLCALAFRGILQLWRS